MKPCWPASARSTNARHSTAGLASHDSVNGLRPAVGERFIARARVVKPGRIQVFTACDLFACQGGQEKRGATGETLVTVTDGQAG